MGGREGGAGEAGKGEVGQKSLRKARQKGSTDPTPDLRPELASTELCAQK